MNALIPFVRRHKTVIILSLIFLFGTLLRIWGLSSAYQRVDDIPVARHIQTNYLGDWRPDPVLYYPIFFNYIAVSFIGGLAVATKYNGVFIVFSILAAHLFHASASGKKRLFQLVDWKSLSAGFITVAGFFAGHPYGLLRFRTFVRASRQLINLVRETEWFLTPIRPETLIEHIRFNKYSQALWNILTGEGAVFLGLILLGLVCIALRRRRENLFIALSGAFYFFGALGFLGFSRHRDLVTMAVEKGHGVGFDHLKYRPDTSAFFKKKHIVFQPLLENAADD